MLKRKMKMKQNVMMQMLSLSSEFPPTIYYLVAWVNVWNILAFNRTGGMDMDVGIDLVMDPQQYLQVIDALLCLEEWGRSGKEGFWK